ncbi:hypothetical protein MSAN_00291100 [Mycena sanguinolenta]|uniref:DUF6534 domain-containing protein n=1 Tax=Mycena sanguinolenta TaxID=230812 RepID=A0A8H6Z7R8_9AGAR|nr:hypothetical protein MSAN_00291100 [Mycena sanguinolenta]
MSIIPGVEIARLTGPMILGYMWSYMLYGVLLVQIYMYTELFPTDRPGLKLLVWVDFFFETVFTVLMTIAAWSMFGDGWGNPAILLQLNWTWGVMPLLSGILSGLAQGFYIWRIWHLTKSFWIPVPITLAVLAQLGGLWWFGIKWNIGLWHVSVLPPLSGGVTVWLAGSAVCDVLITIALTAVLWRRKKETKFSETSGILNRLIRLSIETGALTSITATVEVILWLGWEEFNYHFTLFLMLGKMYSNVLMATLNCRNPIFLKGSSNSQGVVNSQGGTTSIGHVNPPLQPAFWSEPNDRPRVPVVNAVRGVHVSRNIYVDNSTDSIVMTNFNLGAPRDDVEKGSVGKL